jgi:hypothetical protein
MLAILETGDNGYNDHDWYNYKCSVTNLYECNQISGGCKVIVTCAGTCVHRDSPAGAYCSGTKAIRFAISSLPSPALPPTRLPPAGWIMTGTSTFSLSLSQYALKDFTDMLHQLQVQR